MKSSKVLRVEALSFVVLQVFLLFLPICRYESSGRYATTSESYSAVQMITNFSDTVNDPSIRNSDDSDDIKLIEDCRMFSFIMTASMLFAIALAVSSCAFDSARLSGMSLILSSLLLVLVPILGNSFLKTLCSSEDDVASLTTPGGLLIFFALFAVVLAIASITTDNKETQDQMEQEIIERLKNADSDKADYLKAYRQ